jgi:hypothetical protein
VSLGVAATAVDMSATTIGALVSRADSNTILNGDGDQNDTVVEVHPATVGGVDQHRAGRRQSPGLGPRAVFLTPESMQGNVSLNPPDTDTTDRVLQIWDTSVPSGNLTTTQRRPRTSYAARA